MDLGNVSLSLWHNEEYSASEKWWRAVTSSSIHTRNNHWILQWLINTWVTSRALHTHARHVYKSASFSLFAVCFPLFMDREARSSGEAERLLSAVTRQIVGWWSGRVWRRDPGSGPRPPLIHYPAADWLMCCCFTLCERFRDVNDLELDTRHHDRCLVACFLYVSRFFKGFYLVFISDTFVLDAASLSLSLGVCLRPSSPGWVTV